MQGMVVCYSSMLTPVLCLPSHAPQGYDATSHFETEIHDVMDLYRRITGEHMFASESGSLLASLFGQVARWNIAALSICTAAPHVRNKSHWFTGAAGP